MCIRDSNYLLYSNTFTNAAWTKTAVTVTANSTTAPDGTTTASTLAFTNATNSLNQAFSPSNTPFVTQSIYLKAGTDTTYTLTSSNSIQTYGASCTFNLSTGIAGSVTQFGAGVTGSTAAMVSVGNGWYRCSLTVYAIVASWYFYGIGVTNGNYVYAWQAQEEPGFVASPPTITTSAAIVTNNNISAPTGAITCSSINSVRPNNGFFFSGGNQGRFQWDSVNYQQVDYQGFTNRYSTSFNWVAGTLEGTGIDTSIYRDAAGAIGQRFGTSPQTYNLYNTYTSGTNYEAHSVTWSSNVCYAKNTVGTSGTLRLYVPVTGATVVASLPSASTAGIGARSMVTDALAPSFGVAVTGGGAVKIPVYSDGTTWLVG